jgi:outer membrane immunogenic protein
MKLSYAAIIATLAAGNAMAGSLSYTPAEPQPDMMAVASAPMTDWSGFYAGLQYGTGEADASSGGMSIEDDMEAYGIHVGYLHDLGQYVVGGELAYNNVSLDSAPDDDGDQFELRGRAGVDLGRFLPYATLGIARTSSDGISETGLSYGVGAEYLITDRFSVGLEYSHTKFDDVDGSGIDVDTDLFQLRTSYRF